MIIMVLLGRVPVGAIREYLTRLTGCGSPCQTHVPTQSIPNQLELAVPCLLVSFLEQRLCV